MIWVVSNVLGLVAAAPLQIAGIHAESRGVWLVGHMMGSGASLSFAALAGTLLYFDSERASRAHRTRSCSTRRSSR